MSRFLITYHGMPYPEPDIIDRTRGALHRWAVEKLGDAMVDFGAPLLLGGQVSVGQPHGAVEIDGYTIIEASSLSEVRDMLADHPYLALGGTLQINECQPM
jgi:hypothetical protein